MKETIEILARRKRVFIIPLVVVFLIPTVISFFFMRSYEASALVWLDSDAALTPLVRDSEQPEDSPIKKSADMMSQLLQSRSFVKQVIARTDLKKQMTTARNEDDLVSSLQQNLTCWPSGSNSLKIVFNGSNPVVAKQVVKAVIDLYMRWNLKSIEEQNISAVNFFDEQVKVYRVKMDKSNEALRIFKEGHPETQLLEQTKMLLSPMKVDATPEVQLKFERLQKEQEAASKLYNAALDNLAKARVLGEAESWKYHSGFRIIDYPHVSSSFSKKRPLLVSALSLIIALIVAILAVAAFEVTDRTLRTEQDVKQMLKLPVLAAIPKSSGGSKEARRFLPEFWKRYVVGVPKWILGGNK